VRLIKISAFALADGRSVRRKTKPGEILEDRFFKRAAAALRIVIFDSEKYTPAARPGDAPDLQRVVDMTKVEVARRSGGEPRNWRFEIGDFRLRF